MRGKGLTRQFRCARSPVSQPNHPHDGANQYSTEGVEIHHLHSSKLSKNGKVSQVFPLFNGLLVSERYENLPYVGKFYCSYHMSNYFLKPCITMTYLNNFVPLEFKRKSQAFVDLREM